MNALLATLALPAALALLVGGEGDLVVLKNGKSLRGRLVFADQGELVLRQDRRDTRIERAGVERVEARLQRLPALLDEATLADLSRPAELERLATRAGEAGLSGEAQAFWWRILLLDQGHEGARRALGHEKRGGAWKIPLGARKLDWEKRLELARDWGSAWEFESLHYRLRSNLPLQQSLDVLLDLERVYLGFYELFGRELGLYDVCRPMSVNLHADSASYPESASEFGHYEPVTDVVLVDASRGLAFETVAHELTHQLLYDTAFREKDTEGLVPPWVNEGLAEYVAAAVAGSAPLAFDPGRPEERHFRAHAEAKKPFDLTRVLSFSVGDYQSSSDRALKYAQSYTLVHFLLHGAERRHRAGFFEFLRQVYRGKGSSTDLKRALDVDWRELEDAWLEHVRAQEF